MSGCVSRKEIKAATWLNNGPLPAEICQREPSLANYGFYRKLNSGKFEFISYCDKGSADWISFYKVDFNNILDRLIPRKTTQKVIKETK